MLIEVNLLPGQKKRKVGAGITLPDFGAMLAGVKDPLLLGAIGSWMGALLVIAFLFVTTQAQLVSLRSDATQIRAEARRYQALMADKRRSENLRDSLELELRAIRRIDSDRYVWPHIMEEVTKALPDYTWLVGLVPSAPAAMVPRPAGQRPGAAQPADTMEQPLPTFVVEGRTSDIGAYTRFLRQLAGSPWVTDVVPGATSTVIEDDKALTAFNITGTFRRADSAFIRTVPLRESVR